MAEEARDSVTSGTARDSDPSGPYRLNQMIGKRFTLLRKIGTGGYGTVWLAHDAATRTDVALKILHPHLRENVLAVERFSREARVLERLDHPNVARPVAWGADEEEMYLALELVDGVTLKEELSDRAARNAHYSLEQIARFVFEIGGALAHAHALGIVHRDLKPANIMLVRKGGELGAKVLDFGIAKVLAPNPGDETTIGRLLGSWLYMAPEQVRGESIDHRSDIFALGTTLFEMLTLKSAFARNDEGHPMPASNTPDLGHGLNNRYNLLRRIVLEPRPRPSDSRAGLSPAVDRVVLRALEFDPKDRFQSAAELVRAFEAAIDPGKLASDRLPNLNAALARAETALPQDLLAHSQREAADALEQLEAMTDPPDVDTDTGGTSRSQLTPAEAETQLVQKQTVVLPEPAILLREDSTAKGIEDPDTAIRAPKESGPFRAVQAPALVPRRTLIVALAVLVFVLAGLTLTVERLFFQDEVFVMPIPSPDPQVVQRAKVQPKAEDPPEPPPAIEPRVDREEPPPAVAPPVANTKRPTPPRPTPPRPEAAPKPYADLKRMLEEVRAHPTDLDRIASLSDRIAAEGEKLQDKAMRTSIKRCATASAISGDLEDLSSCLAKLESAASH